MAAQFPLTPESLANTDEKEIRKAIRIGGLYKIKSKIIKRVSKEVLDKFNGDISHILKSPKKEAKRKLMKLPGVGDKTADILLANQYTYREVIPIDTHIKRPVKRIGLVESDVRNEKIQQALISFIPEKKRDKVARLLWFMAKHTCRAPNPECDECLFAHFCSYGKENRAEVIACKTRGVSADR